LASWGLRSKSLHPHQLLDLPNPNKGWKKEEIDPIFFEFPKTSPKETIKEKINTVTTSKNFPCGIQSPVGKHRVLLNRFSMD
jgi:hypothetical protein